MKTKFKTIRFKLFDTREKEYLNRNDGRELSFSNKEMADEYRHNYLQKGNYPDYPTTVILIHEFFNNKFIASHN